MPISFREFTAPSPDSNFSERYFQELTFQEVDWQLYPTILCPGMVKTYRFLPDVVSVPSATEILVHQAEMVPNMIDLKPIMDVLEHEYMNGMCSVQLWLSGNPSDKVVHYHFSKLCLIGLVNTNFIAVVEAQSLVRHIQESSALSLTQHQRASFLDQPILSSLQGFYSIENSLKLWNLSCLVEEEWLYDDIANVLCELQYLRTAASSPNSPPSHLLLPVHFANNLELLHAEVESGAAIGHENLTPELKNLRARIQHTRVDSIGFLVNENIHYSAYLRHAPGEYDYGDTLNLEPSRVLTDALNWFLEGIPGEAPVGIHSASIERQPPGSGSCGVGAFNFLQQHHVPGTLQWTHDRSSALRDQLLKDLISYHLVACQRKGETFIHDWSTLVIPNKFFVEKDFVLPTAGNSEYCGYNDFNNYALLPSHPIFEYISARFPGIPLPSLAPAFEPSSRAQRKRLPTSEPMSATAHAKRGRRCSATDDEVINLLSPDHSPPHNPVVISLLSPDSSFHRSQSPMSLDTPPNNPAATTTNVLFTPPPSPRHRRPGPHKLRRTPSIELGSPPKLPQLKRVRSIQSITPPPPSQKPVSTCYPTKRSSSVESISPPPAPPPPQTRNVKVVLKIAVGEEFPTFEAAKEAIYAAEEQRGFKWITDQRKIVSSNGEKVTIRCNHGRTYKPQHSLAIDPADHRQGRSLRTDCQARANLITRGVSCRITTLVLEHNHPRQIPEGGRAARPPTKAQKEVVASFATSNSTKFSRSHIQFVLDNRPDLKAHNLEPRQISNLVNAARNEARRDVDDLGGSIEAILANLEDLRMEDARWTYHLRFEGSVIAGILWQSPLQVQLVRRFGDVVINDNSYNRNDCGWPLNIGICIDGFGKSRNVWYCVQKHEDHDSFSWVWRCLLKNVDRPPEVVVTDRHTALISSISEVLPLTYHIYCLHHLAGNIKQNLQGGLGAQWGSFLNDFWDMYRSVSPAVFDRLFDELVKRYPSTREYLEDEIYPSRERWAWAWVSLRFTSGVRTNGRSEAENRINKDFGGPTTSLKALFDALNERTNNQKAEEMIKVRDSARRQHAGSTEMMFSSIMDLLRAHLGPFALHKCFEQLKECMFYTVDVVQRPAGDRYWQEYAIQETTSMAGFKWYDGEEKNMFNTFNNDAAYVDLPWLFRSVVSKGFKILQLYRIRRIGTSERSRDHYLVTLDNGAYACDCCMGQNLGIPCRHFFKVYMEAQGLEFNIGLIRPRWYQNTALDPTETPSITFTRVSNSRSLNIGSRQDGSGSSSNPIVVDPSPSKEAVRGQQQGSMTSKPTTTRKGLPASRKSLDEPRPTDTIPAREVFHTTQTEVKALCSIVQTKEDLDRLVGQLRDIRNDHDREIAEMRIADPPRRVSRGRPRTQRLTSAIEGQIRGGGAQRGRVAAADVPEDHSGENRQQRRCGICRKPGHTRRNCPLTQALAN